MFLECRGNAKSVLYQWCKVIALTSGAASVEKWMSRAQRCAFARNAATAVEALLDRFL